LLTSQVPLAERQLWVRAAFRIWKSLQGKGKLRISDQFKDFKEDDLTGYDACVLSGYFQDFNWVGPLAAHMKTNLETIISKDIFSLLKRENPIAIHMRFGDFLHPEIRKSLGEIDSGYYSQSLGNFRDDKSEHNLWIFTDDSNLALSKLYEAGINNFTFVSSFGLNVLEEFALLALCDRKIISNSTFSWWASYVSPTCARIVSPSPLTNERVEHEAVSPTWTREPVKFKP